MALLKEFAGYPPEYYNYGQSAPNALKQPLAGWSADRALTQAVGRISDFAGYPSDGILSNANKANNANNPIAHRDPGVTSALEGLEQVVASLSKLSYDLENTLGLSIPEPCNAPSKDAYVPSLVVRLQNLGNQIDSANYRINKSVTHLKS